ncbi:SET domain-containing protein [Trichoderma compactum]
MKLIIIPNRLPYAAVSLAFQQRIISGDVCSSALLQVSHSQQDQLERCRYFGQHHLNAVSLTNSSSPWTSQGNCHNSTETFCVFSSKAFAGGRGISILTSSDRVENLQQLPAFTDRNALSGVNEQPSPPFEEKELPGRGRGPIANKMLHRGDRIFAHTPILMLDSEIFGELETDQWLELEHAGVNNLPPKTKKVFSALYGSPVTDPVSDRIDTNAFVLDLHGVTYYAVFPETARLNHDCQTLTHYVHAITDIAPGTEITITYIDPHMSRESRLKKLSSLWGFNCSCSLCSLHSDLAHESDERLDQINTIRERLEDWETAPPQMALALISLYEQEHLHAPSSLGYWYAALTSCAEGLYWDTIRYARLAIELGMLDYGFKDEDFQLMRSLAKEPRE